jgi:peptidoglycan/LPS O-acetylase OafA/YrhL
VRSLIYLLSEIGRAILYVCAVALPAIAAWGLVVSLVYGAKFWPAGPFWYLGIGGTCWLFLCWRSPQPRRTLGDLLIHIVTLIAFMLVITISQRITARSSLELRDIVSLIFSVLLFAVAFGIAARRRLHISPGSNQALERTATRRVFPFSDD